MRFCRPFASCFLACFSLLLNVTLTPFGARADETPVRIAPVQAPLSLAAVAQSAQCGNSANADIVIMIDRTGSISANDLLSEKNAAKTLLTFFNSAAVKPHVAIGSFSASGGKNPPPAARIETNGGLTGTYGNDNPGDTGLYEVINNMTSGGGNTDISAALTTAQAELVAHGTTPSRYIILISDGIANLPSNPNASSCSGGTPGSAANTAADSAEAAGTQIFAIHFGGDGSCASGTGKNFLSSQIATVPSDFYEGNSDLSAVLNQISQSIACDDHDDCTADSCDTSTNQCLRTIIDPTDSDGDGVTNCYDACPLDPNKSAPGQCGCGVAEDISDVDGDGFIGCKDSCPNDPQKAAPGVCGCGIPDITSGGGGDYVCLCHSVDVTVDKGALGIGPEQLADYANSSFATLVKNAKKTNKALGKRLKKSADAVKPKMAKFIALANQQLDQLPAAILTCSTTTQCASVNNADKLQIYKSAVAQLANLAIHTLNRATRLVYPSVKVARKKTGAFGKTIKLTRDGLYTKADGYPKSQSVCTN